MAFEVSFDTETIDSGKIFFPHEDPEYVFSFFHYLLNNYNDVDIRVIRIEQPSTSPPVGHA